MGYLYGDSSPSPLQSDFLSFLSDALDFSVSVLLADERIKRGLHEAVRLRRAADEEVNRLEALAATVKASLEKAPKGKLESPTARYATTIQTEIDAALR